MPFVTKNGSKRLNWDITYNRHDHKTGECLVEGNGLKPLVLTAGEDLDYRTENPIFHEIVWRGQPDPVKKCWNGSMPVFRILTNRFETDDKDSDVSDWSRFTRDYEREINPPVNTRQRISVQRETYYEPDLSDIVIDKDGNKHFPLWVIERLIELGEFEMALKTNKVDLPHIKKLDQRSYNRIKEEIEKRRELEGVKPKGKQKVGNVS